MSASCSGQYNTAFTLCIIFFQTTHFFSPQVWLEAATQIFFSLGVSIGALVALASYTKPRYNNLANSFIVCITNALTSIFSSIIIFSIVGFRAANTGTDIELVGMKLL